MSLQVLMKTTIQLTTKIKTPRFVASDVKRPVRYGLIKELVEESDPPISQLVYSSLDLLSSNDCKWEEVSLNSDYALASYYTIAMAEARQQSS